MATLRLLPAKIIMLLAVLAISSPAQAMLLSGQVEQAEEVKEVELQNQKPQAAPPNFQGQQQKPKAEQARPQSPTANSFPASYQGAWYCETTVIDSTLPAVAKGQVIGSEVVFYSSKDGTIHARWNQPGWVETQSQAITFNGTEAKADRTTYYFGDNMQGNWAARGRDQFAQTGPDAISAKSYVDQYMDGQYLGRYRTVSVLKRTGLGQNMANMN
jgi:hypothetical protein